MDPNVPNPIILSYSEPKEGFDISINSIEAAKNIPYKYSRGKSSKYAMNPKTTIAFIIKRIAARGIDEFNSIIFVIGKTISKSPPTTDKISNILIFFLLACL